jgi:uncharacterized integral membrane protein
MANLLRNVRSIVFGLLIVLFLILMLQNTEVIKFEFLVYEGEMSSAVLILLFLIVGFLLGYYVGRLQNRQRRARRDQKRHAPEAGHESAQES